MNMQKILKNFDDAAGGKKTAGKADAGSMKAILESFDRVAAVEECGMMPSAMPTGAPQREGSPVSMNISLNASGKDNVDELMALLKGAGLSPQAAPAMGPSEPPDMGALRAMVMKPEMPDMDDEEDEIEVSKEEWDNSPEEQYSDHETMTKDLSGGINRQKKQFKPAAKGDNPMAVESVKERLWAALNEKKSKPDFLDIDKDGDKKEPMKKAAADKKKGSAPKKGVNPFAKKK
jgi:hypothetical protein